MSTKICKIHAAWNEYSSVITKKETSLRNINIDEIIGSFFCPGPFCYYIFDFTKLSYTYIHPNLKEIFGGNPDTFTIDDLIALVHPEDIPHMSNGEKMAFDFIIKKMPRDKRKKYKVSYSLRLKTANGSYKLFLQQAVALTLDKEGNLGQVIGVYTDISHLTTVNNYKVSFIGLDGEPSYHNIDPATVIDSMEPPEFPFSKREMEIIRLLAEGFSVKEIAEKLFIAEVTVRTHQKNILSKFDCRNTIELVSKCIREGLI